MTDKLPVLQLVRDEEAIRNHDETATLIRASADGSSAPPVDDRHQLGHEWHRPGPVGIARAFKGTRSPSLLCQDGERQ